LRDTDILQTPWGWTWCRSSCLSAPWFSSEILALYKSLTYLLT